MSVSRRNMRRALIATMGSGALAGAVLFGGATFASADPPSPGCTAGDLAQVSGAVGTKLLLYINMR